MEFREDTGANFGDEGRRETSRTESDEDNAVNVNNVNTVGFHKHHHIQLETQIWNGNWFRKVKICFFPEKTLFINIDEEEFECIVKMIRLWGRP